MGAGFVCQIQVGDYANDEWCLAWMSEEPSELQTDIKNVTPVDPQAVVSDDAEVMKAAVLPSGKELGQLTAAEHAFLDKIGREVKGRVIAEEAKEAQKEEDRLEAEAIEAGEIKPPEKPQ